MRKTQGPSAASSKAKNPLVEKLFFTYEVVVSLEKYELENILETSAAFMNVAFKIGNKRVDGLEKAHIIKKVAKFKNENFKIDTNFFENPTNPPSNSSLNIQFKEKKAEFLIFINTSSSKSSKTETLTTIPVTIDLSAYLNDQILEKDEVLAIKGSKFSGFFSFHIAFKMKLSTSSSNIDTKTASPSPSLRRAKSSSNFFNDNEENEEKKSDNVINRTSMGFTKDSKALNKQNSMFNNSANEQKNNEKKTMLRKKTVPGDKVPKIIVKGPPIQPCIQKLLDKNPDELLENKLNSLLGSGLQTGEETEILNRKLEIMALKEENIELKEEIEREKEEKNALLKALAELKEEKKNWFKCFQDNEKNHNNGNNELEQNYNHNKQDISSPIAIELLGTLKSFEEKFLKEEEKLKQEIQEMKKENSRILKENHELSEKKKDQSIEILKLQDKIKENQEVINGASIENQRIQENLIKLKEDLGNVINIVLTKGNAEIMDAIEPFLK